MKNGIYIEKHMGYMDSKVHYKDNIVFYVEYANGDNFWYNEDGQLHRLDGPAAEYKGKTHVKMWYINDKFIKVKTQEEFEQSEEYKEFMRLEELRAFE